MFDVFFVLLLAGFGAIFVLLATQSGFRSSERMSIWACYVAHIVCVGVMIWVTNNVFGGGDIFFYERYGSALAEELTTNFRFVFPETIRLLLQREFYLPLHIPGGGSTDSMVAISGLLQYVFLGSFVFVSTVVSLVAFSGQFAIYVGLRDYFAPHLRRRLQVAVLLVPSVVFWTSGLLKEAVALGGLGWIVLGALRWIQRDMRARHYLLLAVGIPIVGLIKAYLLIPLVCAFGTALYWNRSNRSESSVAVGPFYFLFGIGAAVAGMIGIGEVFPEFALNNLGDQAAHLQEVGQQVTGGSSYQFGDPTERSLTGQLAFAPLALLTALFRPLIVEIHNTAAFVNAVETTAILGLFVRAWKHHGLRRLYQRVFSSSALVFCLVFTLICAVGVGLTTTNLGTLSRYRVPLMPFFVCLLLMLNPPFRFGGR